MSLLRRRRAGGAGAAVGVARGATAQGGTAQGGTAQVGSAQRQPHAGVLRRERRALVRAREVELRNLGGLVAEMYRRGTPFRDDLLAESCSQVVGIDARIGEIDEILSASGATCTCGAPVFRGSHFCANCGRAVDAPAKSTPVEDTMIERAAREDA